MTKQKPVTSYIGRTLFSLIAFSLLLIFSISTAYSNPELNAVVAGSADAQTQGNTYTINVHSNKAILNYNSFSIAGGETTRFNQPSPSSIALNRVVGQDASAIYGNLTANGQIFLINPNGILFGPNSRVDTAGLVASTLNISNQDFLAGKYNFSGQGGYIINQGQIISQPGGYACFLSSAIDNQGLIQADLGTVVLAAGEKMTLGLDDLAQISVVIDEAVKQEVLGPDGEKMDNAIDNSGTIQANGGKVIINAKVLNNVFDYAINNSGIIEAKSLSAEDGTITLAAQGAPVLNSGKIEAGKVVIDVPDDDFTNRGQIISNGSPELPDAGIISIKAVNILQSGLVSADAYNGGLAGEVEIISVTQTVLDENSTTSAACPYAIGSGGRIQINSRRGNTFVKAGAIVDVSAGSIKGDAGSIEISAFEQLGFYGILNGRAPPGYNVGTAILDPADATISGIFDLDTTIISSLYTYLVKNLIISSHILSIQSKYILVKGNIYADGAPGQDAGSISLQSSISTLLDTNSYISANGFGPNSSGGEIKILSDLQSGKTIVREGVVLQAKGGQTGDGGFIEISGYQFSFHGTADVTAQNGLTGTILFDPWDITITDGGPTGDDAQVSDNEILFPNGGTGTSYTISETALEGLSGNIILQAYNDISLGSLISNGLLNLSNVTDGSYFLMQAGRHIYFVDPNNEIRTAGGDIHLEADSYHSGLYADGIGSVGVVGNELGKLTSNGGDITLIGRDFVFGNTIDAGDGTVTIGPAANNMGMSLGYAGALLTDAELDLIIAGKLVIGKATTAGDSGDMATNVQTYTAGVIAVDDLSAPAGWNDLTIHAVSLADSTNETGIDINTGTLSLQIAGAIGSSGDPFNMSTDPATTGILTITTTG
ncbi:MAG: filamentous hemagglutinin N-terminal domain-containing protein, partial [Candidatus Omnitrophota bacterium]